MIKTESLQYRYPGGKTFSFPDMHCEEAGGLIILGASGSGKTTLLHLLAGILTPLAGQIMADGVDIAGLKPSARDHFRGQHMGMIMQRHLFIPGLSVFENLIAAQRLSGSIIDKDYLIKLTKRLDIEHLNGNSPGSLSQGEQQRFSIARALANKPKWILADEPTSSLDDDNCHKFCELMQVANAQQPATWIIATHDARLKSRSFAVYQL